VDSLAKRPARPHLQIVLNEGDQTLSSESLYAMVSGARSAGLQPDSYLFTVIATNQRQRSLRLFQKPSADHSEESTSSSLTNVLSSDQLHDGCLGYRCCGVRLSGSTGDLKDGAVNSTYSHFGVLCPSSDGKRAELLVFPFNFPLLLPLLQQAKETLTRIGGVANLSLTKSPNSLPQTWEPQLKAYLRTVPPYYYPSLYKTFKGIGLHVVFSLLLGSATSSPPPPDLSLSRPCMRQLTQVAQKAKADLCLIDPSEAAQQGDTAGVPIPSSPRPSALSDGQEKDLVDSSLLEYSPMSHRGPLTLQRSLHWKNPSSLLALGITSSTHRSVLTVTSSSVYHPTIPHLGGIPPAPQDLLYTWEKIRATVYGGTGLTVRGLFVAGLNGTSSGSHLDQEAQHHPDWFFKACGGATVPRLSIACMSDYVSVLARREALRDPELTSPPPDEDQPQGILKRSVSCLSLSLTLSL
jgi:hypothetical protein